MLVDVEARAQLAAILLDERPRQIHALCDGCRRWCVVERWRRGRCCNRDAWWCLKIEGEAWELCRWALSYFWNESIVPVLMCAINYSAWTFRVMRRKRRATVKSALSQSTQTMMNSLNIQPRNEPIFTQLTSHWSANRIALIIPCH